MDRTLKNLALVLLLAFLALPLFAQMGGTTAKPLTVQVGGSPLGSVYGPRTINFVSGCTGSLSGSAFQITCSGGGGGSPAGSLYAVQVNNPSGTFGCRQCSHDSQSRSPSSLFHADVGRSGDFLYQLPTRTVRPTGDRHNEHRHRRTPPIAVRAEWNMSVRFL